MTGSGVEQILAIGFVVQGDNVENATVVTMVTLSLFEESKENFKKEESKKTNLIIKIDYGTSMVSCTYSCFK
jgi:hypothetical protein